MRRSLERNGPLIGSVIATCRRRLWPHQFLRFLIVGAGNTIFGYLLYVIGLWIGLPYQTALICATMLGATFNFFTTGRLVFESKAMDKIISFLAIYGVTLVVNLALLSWLVGTGMAKAYAQAALLPFVVALSFILNKYLVFGRAL